MAPTSRVRQSRSGWPGTRSSTPWSSSRSARAGAPSHISAQTTNLPCRAIRDPEEEGVAVRAALVVRALRWGVGVLPLCSPLKGIMFWRWDAVAATISVGVGDNALTLATSSAEFQVLLSDPSSSCFPTCLHVPSRQNGPTRACCSPLVRNFRTTHKGDGWCPTGPALHQRCAGLHMSHGLELGQRGTAGLADVSAGLSRARQLPIFLPKS